MLETKKMKYNLLLEINFLTVIAIDIKNIKCHNWIWGWQEIKVPNHWLLFETRKDRNQGEEVKYENHPIRQIFPSQSTKHCRTRDDDQSYPYPYFFYILGTHEASASNIGSPWQWLDVKSCHGKTFIEIIKIRELHIF